MGQADGFTLIHGNGKRTVFTGTRLTYERVSGKIDRDRMWRVTLRDCWRDKGEAVLVLKQPLYVYGWVYLFVQEF
jgi:hypothetical protein